MLNRKLLEITKLLTPAQTKRLRQFLASPYFNNAYNAGQILELFDKIQACKSDEQHPGLDKAALSRHFFPEKKFRLYAKNTIDSLTFSLLSLVKTFLALETAREEMWDSREYFALAGFYRSHNLEERFWQNIDQWRKALEGEPYRHEQYYLHLYYLENEVAAFRSTFNTYSDDANLLAAHQSLDAFYTLLKLELTCALDFQRRLGPPGSGEEHVLRNAVRQQFSQVNHLKFPLSILYNTILDLLEQPDNDENFNRLEQLLEQHRREIEPVKYRNLQAYYRFFAGKQYVKYGGPEVLAKIFDLYERHLKEGYLQVDGKLLPATLKTLVNIALKLRKTDWVNDFLLQYGPQRITGTRYPVESHSLCVAELYFHTQEYAKAHEHLRYCHFENINYSILADVLLIKIYVETRDVLLDSRMKALIQKVRRAPVSAESKIQYLNFIKKLDKIIKYGWLKKTRKLDKLEQEIRLLPAILEREWLLNLLGRLAGR